MPAMPVNSLDLGALLLLLARIFALGTLLLLPLVAIAAFADTRLSRLRRQ